MKPTAWWLAGLLPIVVLAGATYSTSETRWQYLVALGAGSGVKPERHTTQLDSLGAQGWELVSVTGLEMGGNTGGVVMYLKRPLP